MSEENPAAPALRYVAALIEGSITLFDVITLSGFMSFTASGSAPTSDGSGSRAP